MSSASRGVEKAAIRVCGPTGEEVDTDLVLWATGRVPNTTGLGLEKLGVELDANGAVVVDEYSQTTVPGIFAIGDCTDRMALTPVAIGEAMALVETLNGTPTAMDYSNIPTAVFSRPQIGTVGLTEDEARASGHEVVVYRSTFRPMLNTLSGRDEHTMMKLVVDRGTDRVLGVHMVGPDAGEIIAGLRRRAEVRRHQGAVRRHRRDPPHRRRGVRDHARASRGRLTAGIRTAMEPRLPRSFTAEAPQTSQLYRKDRQER